MMQQTHTTTQQTALRPTSYVRQTHTQIHRRLPAGAAPRKGGGAGGGGGGVSSDVDGYRHAWFISLFVSIISTVPAKGNQNKT